MLIDLEIIRGLDAKIRRKSTGTPQNLAESLGISRRHVFRYLEYLRDDCGLEINYDKDRETYYYSNSATFYLLKLGKE
jgi:predicted DNA-binding transcriptional regulator YafY